MTAPTGLKIDGCVAFVEKTNDQKTFAPHSVWAANWMILASFNPQLVFVSNLKLSALKRFLLKSYACWYGMEWASFGVSNSFNFSIVDSNKRNSCIDIIAFWSSLSTSNLPRDTDYCVLFITLLPHYWNHAGTCHFSFFHSSLEKEVLIEKCVLIYIP